MAKKNTKIRTEFYNTLGKVDQEISLLLEEHKNRWVKKPFRSSSHANRVQATVDRVHNDILEQCGKVAEDLKKQFISKSINKKQLKKKLADIKTQISKLLKESEALIQKEYEIEIKESKSKNDGTTSTPANVGVQSHTKETIPSTSQELIVPSSNSLHSIKKNTPLTDILLLSDVDMVFSNPPAELSDEDFSLERNTSDSPSLVNVTSALSMSVQNSVSPLSLSTRWNTSNSNYGVLHVTPSSTDSKS